jgi:hypothetical protein
MHVLIVTTDPVMRRRLRATLLRFGCDLLDAGTFHAATELLEATSVALIFCEPSLLAEGAAPPIAFYDHEGGPLRYEAGTFHAFLRAQANSQERRDWLAQHRAD